MDVQPTFEIEKKVELVDNKENELYISQIISESLNCKQENHEENKNSLIVPFKEIICSECKENCFIKINDYTINLFGCKNGHKINNILFEKFQNTQNLPISKIACNICKNNINDSNCYNCITCNINLCQECKLNHNNHKIIKNNQKNYICREHYDIYTKYCVSCHKNLCMRCEKEHKIHKTIYFGDILPNNINDNEELKEYISKLNNEIKEMIKKLKKVINNIEIYNKINDNINNYDYNKNRNYQNLKNLNEFVNFKNIIIKDIKNIINDENINNKFKLLMNIYDKMTNLNNSENYIIGEIELRKKMLTNM